MQPCGRKEVGEGREAGSPGQAVGTGELSRALQWNCLGRFCPCYRLSAILRLGSLLGSWKKGPQGRDFSWRKPGV